MKGIPTFRPKRLKQAVVLTGVTALMATAAVLGSGTMEAHAAIVPVSDLGNGLGHLGISEQSGNTSDTITFSSAACPAGSNTSAEVEIADPLNPTASQQLLGPVNNSVSSAFTVVSKDPSTINGAIAGLFDDPAGGTAEIVVECFSGPGGGGTGVFEDDVFVQLSADDSTFQVVAPTSGQPANVSVALAASPNPATSGQSVTLTATVTPSNATGTVQFENNGTNINGPVTIAGGSASTSTTFSGITTATTESLTAVYTPTGNFAATTPGTLSLPVNPAPPNSGTIPLAVSVPQVGTFTLTVDSTDVVTLAATDLSATGTTTPITVADSRNSFPGWSVSGQDGAWTGTSTAAGGTFSGDQLGWTPTDTTLAPGVTLGSPVTAANPGLGTTAATLASVHAGLGNGFGTSTLGANLTLAIPATAPAGPYTSGLTISAVTSNP